MKNQREIYEALLAGETLIHMDSKFSISLKNGNLVYDYNLLSEGEFKSEFNNFDKWQIYKEPKWYENIPDSGVLCWCWDNHQTSDDRRVFVIGDYRIDMGAKFRIHNIGSGFDVATPLTKQEIQVFMDNAPEE